MYENSIALFQTTIDRNPYCWMAHFQLGVRHAAAQQNSQAIAQYREALRLRPKYPEADSNLGAVLMNMGRLAEAIEHLQHVTDVNPEYVPAYNNLGWRLVTRVERVKQSKSTTVLCKRSRTTPRFSTISALP